MEPPMQHCNVKHKLCKLLFVPFRLHQLSVPECFGQAKQQDCVHNVSANSTLHCGTRIGQVAVCSVSFATAFRSGRFWASKTEKLGAQCSPHCSVKQRLGKVLLVPFRLHQRSIPQCFGQEKRKVWLHNVSQHAALRCETMVGQVAVCSVSGAAAFRSGLILGSKAGRLVSLIVIFCGGSFLHWEFWGKALR